MGRGLSDLQKRILTLALECKSPAYTEERRNHAFTQPDEKEMGRNPDIAIHEIVLSELSTPIPIHHAGITDAGIQWKYANRRFDLKTMSPEQRRHYQSVYAAVSRAITRLEQRGLVVRSGLGRYINGRRIWITEQGEKEVNG